MTAGFEAWIGREEERSEVILSSSVAAMAATLDMPQAPAMGDALPPGWQWLFFNPSVRQSGLGIDGHPQRGGFLPPIELPRRMWAGSRVEYLADVPVGAVATKRSRILKVENKTGKRGALWFVTVQHSTLVKGVECIREEQDIVYREPPPPSDPNAVTQPHQGYPEWDRVFTPDTTLLFRYSALTFNGHRIHYDQSYARNEEGYPDLVVHGPLTATLLQKFALDHAEGCRLAKFDFRGVTPLFVNRPIWLQGRKQDDGTLSIWALGAGRELAMSATATFR